ncbi:nucleoside deaminase [Leptolyngbya sp. FACHB-261]|uniref:nucleoside deaminase n=1 Tax=Leptolyngbya sp. FACHB-261 TaxID=2692806 RepID=UPI001684E031|nr:nucleoside deaminase [Leptolyngbya sp. FACHB-261]MBD2099758.1 nucleoside deaminase [Leptolyngbya sp. FACHB-261]
MTDSNNPFMQEAIALSLHSMRTGKGGPYGAVVVKDGEIIGRGMNEVTSRHDPTAHAEMTAIREACQSLQSWQLLGCELYTSCEPCPMCMATIYWAKLARVYYANTKEDAAQFGFNSLSIYQELALPIERRQLPMDQLMQEQALVAFEEWQNKADKAPY